jgi:hypothetical protein
MCIGKRDHVAVTERFEHLTVEPLCQSADQLVELGPQDGPAVIADAPEQASRADDVRKDDCPDPPGCPNGLVARLHLACYPNPARLQRGQELRPGLESDWWTRGIVDRSTDCRTWVVDLDPDATFRRPSRGLQGSESGEHRFYYRASGGSTPAPAAIR